MPWLVRKTLPEKLFRESATEIRPRHPRTWQPGEVRLDSDCSGVETLGLAAREIGLPHHQCFSSEIDPRMRDLILLNHLPDVLYKAGH